MSELLIVALCAGFAVILVALGAGFALYRQHKEYMSQINCFEELAREHLTGWFDERYQQLQQDYQRAEEDIRHMIDQGQGTMGFEDDPFQVKKNDDETFH